LFCCHFLGNLSFEDLLWWNSMVVQRTLTMQTQGQLYIQRTTPVGPLEQGNNDGARLVTLILPIEAVRYAAAVTDCLWAMLREEKAQVSLPFIFRCLAKTNWRFVKADHLRGVSTSRGSSMCQRRRGWMPWRSR
jgi:hypothetical protein